MGVFWGHTMRAVRTLVLWDIDHTLLSIDGLSGEIYAQAFGEVTGRRLDRLAGMAGKAEREIITETLTLNDITPSDALLATFAAAVAAGYSHRAEEIRSRGRVLPGARAALAALAARPDVVQSVLTGNLDSIALCKLTAFDLQVFLDVEVGAYGFDGLQRSSLVAVARARASEKYNEPFPASSTVLVGDTPRDIEAAHQAGARVVAVATGSTPHQALTGAGATQVLPDLCQTSAVLRAILTP
jgi:phosphoglycolate phosphatase-like HAD superfamily hydrolase